MGGWLPPSRRSRFRQGYGKRDGGQARHSHHGGGGAGRWPGTTGHDTWEPLVTERTLKAHPGEEIHPKPLSQFTQREKATARCFPLNVRASRLSYLCR